jgi:hypothetical protein
MTTNIRLIVSDPTQETRQRVISLPPDQTVHNLTATYFPEYNDSRHTVKWIYLGHTLTGSIPSNIENDATIHVVIRERSPETNDTARNPTDTTGPLSGVDKTLLNFIHFVCTIFVGFLWNQYMRDPTLFTSLSLVVLAGISIVLIISVVSSQFAPR